MKVIHGLLLLLCLCGVRGQDLDIGLAFDVPKTADDPATQASKQTVPDTWAEVRALRDMVVELKVQVRSMEARVKESEGQVNDLRVELAVNKLHIEQLQKENTAQATEITSLQTRLTASESRTSALEKDNEDLKSRMRSSESELLNTKSRIDQLEEENTDLKSRMRSSESELLNAKSRIDQLERENTEEKVAFYAGFHDGGKFGPFNTAVTLKYSRVVTNTGSAYNPATGFFTAPVRGVYYFQFTAFGYHAGNTGISMLKNNQQILYNWERTEDATPEFFTNSVILELAAGDQIHLRLLSGHHLFDNINNYSTFSGSLLFLL